MREGKRSDAWFVAASVAPGVVRPAGRQACSTAVVLAPAYLMVSGRWHCLYDEVFIRKSHKALWGPFLFASLLSVLWGTKDLFLDFGLVCIQVQGLPSFGGGDYRGGLAAAV